ncbi:MAG: hypothetical protein JWQ43_4179 [Glaciihabitans sp.]|nr:hypothetical protein [Glaciihabitans sp.]
MHNISYTGETFMIADSAALTLIDLTTALGQQQQTLSVTVPGIYANGDTVEIQMVLGPASELVAIPVESTYAEPESAAAVTTMEQQIKDLNSMAEPPRAQPIDDPHFDHDAHDL